MSVRVINNHLVVQTDAPGQLQAVFPAIKTAVVGGQSFCAVPHTLEAARVLNNIGIKAPSPIRTRYTWPGRFTPRWYQVDTAEFFTLNPRCHCHSAPRTGKTNSALWAADYLRKNGKIKRTLIVAPLSTLWDVWEKAIFESFPLITFCVLHGPKQKRLDLLAQEHDYYIVNHHGVALIEKELANRKDIDLVIIDECFPAGTKVLTPAGERCIETLREGDCVESSWGPMPVTHVFKKETIRLVKVQFDDGTSITCTPEHPLATDRGWIAAEQSAGANVITAEGLSYLRKSVSSTQIGDPKQTTTILFPKVSRHCKKSTGCTEGLPCVWNGVCLYASKQEQGVLLKHVRGAGESYRCHLCTEDLPVVWEGVSGQASNGEVSPAESVFEILQHEVELADTQRSNAGRISEDSREIEGPHSVEQRGAYVSRDAGEAEHLPRCMLHPLETLQKGERDRYDGVRGDAVQVSTARVCQQLSGENWDAEGERVSISLQTGLWKSILDGGGRGRWVEPRYCGEKSTRCEERKVPHYVRVESVQNIELTSKTPVWNLEVTGPQDYIADGKVVHNCATLRNARAKTLFKPLNNVLNHQGIHRAVWGLTGTPTPNEPTDAFGQCKLITPENYRGHFTSFKNETMLQLNAFKWVARKGSEQSVARILKPAIRFERSVCTDMEPCYIERRAQLSSEQQTAYKQLIQKASTEVEGGVITAVNAAVLISKLVQVAAGVAYAADGSLARFDFGPRLAVLEELIEENNEKVLVFVPFTGALDALATELRKRWSVAVVDGGVSAGKRTEIFRNFRTSKDPHILVCHPQVMAHGLDLTTASLSIWYSPYPKAEIYQQANARTDGSKQEVKIDIAHIYATAEERRIYTVLKEKGKLQDVVLDLVKGGGR